MINIGKIFNDFFEDSTITNSRYISFSQDHISRMQKNNHNQLYSHLIAETENSLAGLLKIVNNKNNSTLIDISPGIALDIEKEKLVKCLIRKEESLKKHLNSSLSLHHTLFNVGIEKFENASHEDFIIIMNDFINSIKKYKVELGDVFISEVKALFHIYEISYQRFKHENDIPFSNKIVEQSVRKKLSMQLTKNALFIASNNIAKSEVYKKYFDANLLFAQQRRTVFKDMVDGNSNLIFAELEYNPNKRLKIKNKGSVAISFQMTLNGFAVGNTFTVYPTKVIDKSFSDFYTDGNGLQAINKSNTACFFLVNEVS